MCDGLTLIFEILTNEFGEKGCTDDMYINEPPRGRLFPR